MTEGPWILILNAGSSSLKFAAYEMGGKCLSSGQVAGLDVSSVLSIFAKEKPPVAIGHRVVHGGGRSAAVLIDGAVRGEIEAASALAPLHNPPALKVIDAVAKVYPELPQIACFDTAFHAGNPPEATVIPVPVALRESGIRRYGFHGLSYASLVRRFSAVTGKALPKRLLAMHLGAGASLAAIVDGKGVATTMGFSPMDGLVMATRAGAMDSGVVLHLMRSGMGVDEVDHLLNRESGLLAMAGTVDMREALEGDPFAVAHYCYWVSRHAGSMIAAMQGIDGVVFTGGIGENAAPIRERILQDLSWAGVTNTWIIPADEEGEIAAEVARIMIDGRA